MQCKNYSHFFSKKFQHICVSLDVNVNESLTNDIVSFEQLGLDYFYNVGADDDVDYDEDGYDDVDDDLNALIMLFSVR